MAMASSTSEKSKYRLTYHRRMFLGLVAYSWLLVGCFVLFQYRHDKELKAESLNAQLQLINGRILQEVADGDSTFTPAMVLPHSFDDLRISLIDVDGNVIYDNSLDSLPATNHLNRNEISAAIKYGEGYSVRRHSESTGTSYFYSAKYGDGYVARTAVPYSVNLEELLGVDGGFLWFMVGVTLVMSIIGYFVTHRVGQHISRLNRFAECAERGERIYDTAPFPHDELGEISNHIVRLYARLQQAVADRDREHREALHQEQEKIRIKRQLTNNINHELKTPVAAMQVCLETLLSHKDIPEEKRIEFLNRCYQANTRLQRLMADVSVITRLEDGESVIEREVVNLRGVVSEVCEEFELAAQEKGIEIKNRIDNDLPVEGNQSMLASVFRNLIDNALAYSGGDTLIIAARHRRFVSGAGMVVLTVADNGKGVGEEHLPHIFDRFYRVDKGRSRKAGGTGLGLAIVKNAVLWHGGSIKAENVNTGGLKFTINLPEKGAQK